MRLRHGENRVSRIFRFGLLKRIVVIDQVFNYATERLPTALSLPSQPTCVKLRHASGYGFGVGLRPANLTFCAFHGANLLASQTIVNDVN